MMMAGPRLDQREELDRALEYDDEQEKIWPDNDQSALTFVAVADGRSYEQPALVAQEEPPAQNFRRLKGSFHQQSQ